MERAHGQLRAWLADGLSGDDADRVAEEGEAAGRRGEAVAEAADAPRGLARERAADRDLGHARRFDYLGVGLLDHLARVDEHLARLGVRHRRGGDAADEPVGESRDHDVLFRRFGVDQDAAVGLAVFLEDDHLLRHVDQPPRQIAGVGRAQRRVSESLARAVRGDEVFEHGEALAEARLDGELDDVTARVAHQPPHRRHLLDLGLVPPGARVGHGVDAAELRQMLLDHRVHLRADVLPHADGPVIPLAVRDQSLLVLVLERADLDVGLLDDRLLLFGHLDVRDADGYP